MKNIITKITLITIGSLTLLFSATPILVLATAAVDCANVASLTTQQAIECGVNKAGGTSDKKVTTEKVNSTVKTVINVLSIIVGVVAVIMIMIAGFRYVTSGGKQESVAGAKNTIVYAIVGLVIVALAQIIVRFILDKI